MVGGLVQPQNIPIAHQQAGKIHASTLAARKRADGGFPRDVRHQAGKNVANARVACPFVFGCVADQHVLYGVGIIKLVALSQQSYAHSAVAHHAPFVGLQRAGQQTEQGRFAVAVATDDADARAFVDAQRHVFKHRFSGEFDPHFLATQQKRHANQPF